MDKAFVLGKKLTALSFVVIIIILNFWVIYQVLGTARPGWTQDIFYIAVGCSFVGGLMMLPNSLKRRDSIEESDDSLGN